ncbi:hypothetical protein OAI29_02815 [Amylibacter sp.]|nr:hypothetical protein [Amylibacter sp.]
MDRIWDVIIIGSGPSGVSAAWPLVISGLNVLMLDASSVNDSDKVDLNRPSLRELRKGLQPNYLLKTGYTGLRNVGNSSPKLRLASSIDYVSEYERRLQITSDQFRLVGALAKGGLSKIWGGVSCQYDAEDLGSDEKLARELSQSYHEISLRIGISGPSRNDNNNALVKNDFVLQPPVPLTALAKKFLSKSQFKKIKPNVIVGQPDIAVLTQELNGRQAHSNDFACMWGCKNRSVYSSEYEIENLNKYKNFNYVNNSLVTTLLKGSSGDWVVNLSEPVEMSYLSKRVILAAGTISTTTIILRSGLAKSNQYRLISNPAFSFAIINPKFLGSGIPEEGYGNAQLFMKVPEPISGSYSFGLLYDAGSMCASDIARHMPLSLAGALRLSGALMEATMLSLCYLPGEFSNSKIEIESDGFINITGGVTDSYKTAKKALLKQVKALLVGTGYYLIPGSFKPYEIGSDVHYAGTLGITGELENGHLIDHHGIYIVDGASLGKLPAKNPTLTYMANADRIAKNILKSLNKNVRCS